MRALIIILAVTGCSPKTAAEQAKYAAGHERSNGHVDGSLQPIDEKRADAWSHRTATHLTLHSVADGEICVRKDKSERVDVDPLAQVRARWERSAARRTVAVAVHDSLATFSTWPDRSAAIPGRVVYGQMQDHTYRGTDYRLETSHWLKGAVVWCAPLPAISATTKYITVTKWEPDDAVPGLYVWMIDGTPTATTE